MIEGAKPHPTVLVQSAAMASVALTSTSYRPHLPEAVISDGLLSDAQLETVVYAGEAHGQHLGGYWRVNETFDALEAGGKMMRRPSSSGAGSTSATAQARARAARSRALCSTTG